jgi:FG-GAP-like repeat
MSHVHRHRRRVVIGIAGLILAVVAPIVLAAKGRPGNFRQAPTSPENVGENVGGNTAWGPRIVAAKLDDKRGTDLAVVDSTTSIAILSGKGGGDFRKIGTESVGANPIEITAANFDGKNGTDLAVARDRGFDSVTILLNDGSGDFAKAATSPEAGPGGGITSADLDGDKDTDLAVGSGDVPGEGVVLLNDGSGDFTAGDTFFSSAAELVENADLDHDGDRDVVELAGAGEGALVHFNHGDGNLTNGVGAGSTGGSNVNGIAVGRIGRGPSPDIALGSLGGVYVFLNDGDGGFTPSPRSPLRSGRFFGGVRIADVDRDGRGDILAGEQTDSGSAVAVFLSRRHGRFKEPDTSPEAIASGAGFPWLATGKFDGGKGRDVAAAVEGAVSILLNRSRVR